MLNRTLLMEYESKNFVFCPKSTFFYLGMRFVLSVLWENVIEGQSAFS